jgi:hypothetical protein
VDGQQFGGIMQQLFELTLVLLTASAILAVVVYFQAVPL